MLQLQRFIFVALLLTACGLIAWLSLQHSVQFDWTSNQRNTLSQNSIDILNTMTDPALIKVYVQDDATARSAIEEILKRYQREKADFKFRLINPDIDIEQAQQDNIKQYGQVIIQYQGRKENLNSLSERAISSALLRLSRSGERKIVFISGHGERSITEDNNLSFTKLAAELNSKGLLAESINLLEHNIPDNTHLLVIASPSSDFLIGELELINNYTDQGGNLLWLMDPGKLHGLEVLSTRLGLTFHDGMIVDNNINLRKTLRIEHPAIIPVLEYVAHAITRNIDYNTLFPISRGISYNEDSGWLVSQFLVSLPRSWSEKSGLSSEIVFEPDKGDISGPINIGLALERDLSSEQNTGNKASQRIVVVGDSDFLANSYIGAGANLALGLNIFNWLAGDDALIAVEPRNAPDTQLELNDTEIFMIGTGFFIALPLTLFIAGFTIWYRRRKQ